MAAGRPKPCQTSAMAQATRVNRPRERSMVRLEPRGMRRIAASPASLNQILWFVRLRSDKEGSCRQAAKISRSECVK
jgi:hypothetical protein